MVCVSLSLHERVFHGMEVAPSRRTPPPWNLCVASSCLLPRLISAQSEMNSPWDLGEEVSLDDVHPSGPGHILLGGHRPVLETASPTLPEVRVQLSEEGTRLEAE